MPKKVMQKSPHLPELFFGIVARMGVDVSQVVAEITGEAAKFRYHVVHYKVTDYLKLLKVSENIQERPLEKRYETYISACNTFRNETEDASVFARSFISWLSVQREKHQTDKARGIVYIIDQLKRPEEIVLLREVYGDAFLAVSCHAPLDTRIRNLKNKITASHGASDSTEKWEETALNLIKMDEAEDDDFGQDVRSAFPLADYIIQAQNNDSIREHINRFYRLIFRDPGLSPTLAEHGNNLAAQAAYRSIDLSRQVGAAIIDNNKMVVSLGCNEVPKTDGGTYWSGDDPDRRDQDLGYDENTLQKQALVIDIVQKLQKAKLVADEISEHDFDALKNLLLDKKSGALSKSDILDITEYGRAIHAEMNAITDAARSNNSTQGQRLFVTTFPCHNCAKHIVSSGINEVTYLEPYPKSQVSKLYPDSIDVDPEQKRKSHVRFRQFCGVTKRRYHYFSKERLKDKDGKVFPWEPKKARSIIDRQPSDYERLEQTAIAMLKKHKLLYKTK